MFLLKLPDQGNEFFVAFTGRPGEVSIIALSGNVCYTAEQAYVSDFPSEDAVDGFITLFFLKPDAGIPLSSIRASR